MTADKPLHTTLLATGSTTTPAQSATDQSHERETSHTAPPQGSTDRYIDGLKHSWDWFSLHATQRMQAVNFFLIAAAFLTNAYVSALGANNSLVAAAVATLGAFVAIFFYCLECRVRGLVKAAETPMLACEHRLAQASGILSLEIVKTVESPPGYVPAYSTTFKALYGTSSLGFLLGAWYAARVETPSPATFSLLVGFALVALAYRCYSQSLKHTCHNPIQHIFRSLLPALFAILSALFFANWLVLATGSLLWWKME